MVFKVRNIQFQAKEKVIQYRISNRSEKLHQIYLKQLFVLRCRAIIEFERFLFLSSFLREAACFKAFTASPAFTVREKTGLYDLCNWYESVTLSYIFLSTMFWVFF